eukprot:gene1996-1121_t
MEALLVLRIRAAGGSLVVYVPNGLVPVEQPVPLLPVSAASPRPSRAAAIAPTFVAQWRCSTLWVQPQGPRLRIVYRIGLLEGAGALRRAEGHGELIQRLAPGT